MPVPLNNNNADPFNMNSMLTATPAATVNSDSNSIENNNKTEEKQQQPNLAKNFLGDMGANLVNLDSLSFTTTQPTTTCFLKYSVFAVYLTS